LDRYEAQITFDLPVYIPLPDNIYPVRVGSRVAHIRLVRFEISGELGETLYDMLEKEVQFPRDVPLSVPLLRNDPFNQSQVTVMFRPTIDELKKVENPKLEEKDPYTNGTIHSILNTSIQFVNKLLEAYQHVSGIAAIGFLQPWDISRIDGGIIPLSKEHPHQGLVMTHIGFSRLIRGSKRPFINEEQLKRISEIALVPKLPTQYRLLISARYMYLMGEYSASVIMGQSALETYLRTLLLEKSVTHIPIIEKGKERKWPVRNAGLKRLYNEGLSEIVGKRLDEYDSDLAKEVDKARKIRNDIIHKGKAVSMNEGNSCIVAFAKALHQISQLLKG
jgi:hypothetical protein